MRICFFGDTKIHSKRWIRAISKMGHDVFSVGPTSDEEEFGTNHFGVKRGNVLVYYLLLFFKLRKVIKRERPGVILAHYITTYGFVANLVSNNVICLIMGSDIWIDANSRIKRYLIRYALRKSRRISVVSPSLKEQIIEMGVEPQKIEIIPLGVESEKFSQDHLTLDKLENTKLREFVQTAKVLIVSTRKFDPLYDNMTIVRAAEMVIQENPDIKFVLMGIGSQRRECQQYVKENQLEGNISLPGWLDHDKEVLLSNAQIMVSAAKSDGLPVSVIEALVYRCFPVLGDVRGTRDVFGFDDSVSAPRNVRYFEVGNFEELTNEILEVVRVLEEIDPVVVENFNYAKTHFQLENILENKLPQLLSKI